ncbi:MAG TPA: holo-ACP synthase [Puia sp.]|nr:holo-ACP synthase [Puia sp.]
MIAGVGIDMIEVERVAAKIGKESGFREMVFSKKEIEYCESKPKKFEHYAARFAAKEAFLKAIGTGWKSGISFNEIEVSNVDEGKPELNLTGETAKTLSQMNIQNIELSLSHLKNIASAVVVVEK